MRKHKYETIVHNHTFLFAHQIEVRHKKIIEFEKGLTSTLSLSPLYQLLFNFRFNIERLKNWISKSFIRTYVEV